MGHLGCLHLLLRWVHVLRLPHWFCWKPGADMLCLGCLACRCIAPTVCLKSENQCCCTVAAVAIPCDDEVPCMCACCFLDCYPKFGCCQNIAAIQEKDTN